MPIVFGHKGQNLVFRRCGSEKCFNTVGNSQHLEVTISTWDSPTSGFINLTIIRVCLECKTETKEEVE